MPAIPAAAITDVVGAEESAAWLQGRCKLLPGLSTAKTDNETFPWEPKE